MSVLSSEATADVGREEEEGGRGGGGGGEGGRRKEMGGPNMCKEQEFLATDFELRLSPSPTLFLSFDPASLEMLFLSISLSLSLLCPPH